MNRVPGAETLQALRRPDKAVLLLLTLAVASGLLYLAVPRTLAAFSALKGDAVYRAIQDGETVPPAALRRLAASRERAVRWADAPQARAELGLAELLLALETGARRGQADAVRLNRAEAAVRAALAGSPTSPNAWMRLALVRFYRDGPSPALIPALTMSMLTGPAKKELALSRLDLAMRVWPHLSPDDRKLVFRQARLAWAFFPAKTVALASDPMRAAVIRAALAPVPDALARFEKRLARQYSAKSRK